MQHEQLNLFGLFSTPENRTRPSSRRRSLGHHPGLSLGPAEQAFYVIPERLAWRELISDLQNARRSMLFLVEGGSGHGKSAFLHWLQELLKTHHFAVQYASAIDMPQKQKRDQAQVFLIDDLQDLVFYPAAQSLFCQAFDESKTSWPPVHWIVTSAVKCRDLLSDERLSERVRQRIEGLHRLPLPAPSLKQQLQIANFWRESLGNQHFSTVELPLDIQQFLSSQSGFNGHKLLTLLERLVLSADKQDLLPLAKIEVTPTPPPAPEVRASQNPSPKVSFRSYDPIECELARIFSATGIGREDIFGKSRQQEIVIARFLFIYFLYQSGQYSKLALAKILKKDHTSILYALEKMNHVCEHQAPHSWYESYQRALCWSPEV